MTIIKTTLTALALMLAAHVPAAFAQPPADPVPAADQPAAASTPSDRATDPSQPDFTVITLPTTLRIPRFGSSFRVTHRFTRPLGEGDFSDLVSNAFGIDGGAQIGLEYRFGIFSGTQLGVHRTSERTIEIFGQQEVVRQGHGLPIGIDAVGAVEGANNFREDYSPSIGAVVSRTLGRHGAVYAQPIWVGNTNQLAGSTADNNTFILGLSARLRVRPTVYLLAEATPRFGFRPDTIQASFAIEKRAGGHSFQLNFSNCIGTTFGQIARGGISSDTWYFGFNISRKFF